MNIEDKKNEGVDMTEGKKVFLLEMPKDLHRRLKLASKKKGLSMREIIRKALETELKTR